jgi:predicted Zn-dependent protease
MGLQLLSLKYGRDDENEADALGVRYMGRTSYDPHQLSEVMRMLERTSEVGEGSGRVPEWLSTHPDPGNRVAHIEQVVQESGAPAANLLVRKNEYLHHIDGVVFGANPREGFFENELFRHPDLAFRIQFPRGWKTLNTKQSVQAVSPAQDAAMELTLAEGSPTQAMRSFASQQGVQMGRTSQQSVNGLPAVLAEFAVAAEQGTFRGLVLFVQHGGATYQILGYAPDARWRGYSADVDESLASFERETDRRVLAVEPNRLKLVQLDRSYTLQSFVQRYPSAEEPEVIALINGLESGGALAAGTLAKQVVSGQ